VRAWIEETIRYDGNFSLLQEFQNWEPPKFPVTGHKLIEMKIPAGKAMTQVLNHLRDLWIASDFTMTEDELVAHIPEAIELYKIKLK